MNSRKIILGYALPNVALQIASYGPLAVLYNYHPYFRGLLTPDVLFVLGWYIRLLLLFCIPYYYINARLAPREVETFKKLLASLKRVVVERKVNEVARVHLFKILVKGFFGPLMLSFFFVHVHELQNLFDDIAFESPDFSLINKILMSSLFLVDTLIFSFGYLVETHWLGNSIKSVEPTLFGWVIALICYPPFNRVTSVLFPLGSPNPVVITEAIMTVVQVGILVCFGLYVWASIALLFKSGNLVNRGIVTSGPYRYMRHPAYIGKNIAWWLENITYLNNPMTIISLIGYNAIYALRAITEERHLSRDPAYRAYKKKTRF